MAKCYKTFLLLFSLGIVFKSSNFDGIDKKFIIEIKKRIFQFLKEKLTFSQKN